MPSAYSEKMTGLKSVEKQPKQTSFNWKSFAMGFAAATLLSYVMLFHFMFKSGVIHFLYCIEQSEQPTTLTFLISGGQVAVSIQDTAGASRSNSLLRSNYVKGSILNTGGISERVDTSVNVKPITAQTVINSHLSIQPIAVVETPLNPQKITQLNAKKVSLAQLNKAGGYLWSNSSHQQLDILSKEHEFASRNLMLGIAVNTNSKNFAIFCGSFRAQSPTGEAVVFVNTPTPERHLILAKKHRIHIIEFDMDTLEPEYVRTYHPSSIRWILFDRLLKVNGGKMQSSFDRVIMVDIRDTMFQRDPFALIDKPENTFYVFGETPGSTIQSCGWNSGWIQDCFGEQMLNLVQQNVIICSGISMGSMDVVSDYIAKMSGILLGESDLGKLFPKCERNGVDQGVHNVVIHTGLMKSVRVQYEHNFPVINLQAYPELREDQQDHSVLRSNGEEVYSIVHQYDRLGPLQLGLSLKYVDWLDMSDPKAEWAEEPSCRAYSVQYDKDLFRGKCELGSERLMSAASCCQSCAMKNDIAAAAAAKKGKSKDTTDITNGDINSNSSYGSSGNAMKTPNRRGDYPASTVCTSFTYTGGVCYMKKCRKDEVRASVDEKDREMRYHEPGAISAYL